MKKLNNFKPAIFLDRDDTKNYYKNYSCRPELLKLYKI